MRISRLNLDKDKLAVMTRHDIQFTKRRSNADTHNLVSLVMEILGGQLLAAGTKSGGRGGRPSVAR